MDIRKIVLAAFAYTFLIGSFSTILPMQEEKRKEQAKRAQKERAERERKEREHQERMRKAKESNFGNAWRTVGSNQ